MAHLASLRGACRARNRSSRALRPRRAPADVARLLGAAAALSLLMVVGRLPAYGQGRGGPPDDARATFAQRATILDRIDGGLTEPESAAMAAFEISADEETRLGRLTARKFTDYLAGHGIRVAQTGRDVDYLRKLVTTVRPLMTNADRYRRPTVYLVQSPRCDARVFPGGHLFFFRGLLDAVDNEAALVGVIGHELSHVDRGHALARVRQVLLLDDTFKGQWQNMTCQQSEAVRAAAVRIWDSPLDPEAEAEADRDGVRWAFQAGYDPRDLGRLACKSQNQRPDQKLPGGASFAESYATSAERQQAILAEYTRLRAAAPKVELCLGEDSLRRRIPRRKKQDSP